MIQTIALKGWITMPSFVLTHHQTAVSYGVTVETPVVKHDIQSLVAVHSSVRRDRHKVSAQSDIYMKTKNLYKDKKTDLYVGKNTRMTTRKLLI